MDLRKILVLAAACLFSVSAYAERVMVFTIYDNGSWGTWSSPELACERYATARWSGGGYGLLSYVAFPYGGNAAWPNACWIKYSYNAGTIITDRVEFMSPGYRCDPTSHWSDAQQRCLEQLPYDPVEEKTEASSVVSATRSTRPRAINTRLRRISAPPGRVAWPFPGITTANPRPSATWAQIGGIAILSASSSIPTIAIRSNAPMARCICSSSRPGGCLRMPMSPIAWSGLPMGFAIPAPTTVSNITTAPGAWSRSLTISAKSGWISITA